METDTASVKIENGNIYCYPLYEHPTQPMFVARGAGTELNPIVVEPLEPVEPVRDFHKGIDRRFKELLITNPHVESYRTWNQARTVKTTTYTNVNIVTTDTVSVTAGFENILD